MSLLFDALKRAEQEKLARQGRDTIAAEQAAPAADVSAKPEPAPNRKSDPEPPKPVTEASPAAAITAKRDREGAKAVFAAKQGDTITPSSAAGMPKAILAIAISAVVLLAAGGAYVWYEIRKTPGPMARGPLPVAAPRPVTPASASTPQPGAVTAGTIPRDDPVPPPVAGPKPGNLAAVPEKPKTPPKASEQLVTSLLKESAGAKAAPPPKLSRTIDPPRVSVEVSEGYDALKRGDDAAARKFYEAALAADATNLDAHLGLATAAARAGDRETAVRHYRRTLALDPKNAPAIAGLASLADFSRPQALEAQLRADITRYPQSPALHFTLGNIYASQSRWTEAQAAYFEAYRLDPDSADLAYNLAISLDHLRQARLAADFYQRALAAAGQQAAQFDKGQVARRIAELKQ